MKARVQPITVMEGYWKLMENNIPKMEGVFCPLPLPHHDKIVMGHGSGGRLMNDLIKNVFYPYLENPPLSKGDDAGVVKVNQCTDLAISTDSHVVWPLFFPGGDIGSLAVCGTVNDVAMLGGLPAYLTAGFILEEGLDVETLQRVLFSMHHAAHEAGIQIVAGDTKVVERGKADGLYITTAGVGKLIPGIELGGRFAQPGDVVIVSGTLGDHGIAVLAARGDLGFDTDVQSDIAPLNHMIEDMLESSELVHVLRDPTRGGLASTLNEIAGQSGVCITLNEDTIPVSPQVQATCEILGFDPLYIANEGKLVAIVGREDADLVLEVIKKNTYGSNARIIGEVHENPENRVLMKTTLGSTRVVDTLSGELLPRIC